MREWGPDEEEIRSPYLGLIWLLFGLICVGTWCVAIKAGIRYFFVK